MKRINSMRLVGPTIIVLVIMAVGQIGAMDPDLRQDFIELQRRIDTGDLAQVMQLVDQKNLKGHLNDQYTCKYVRSDTDQWLFEHMPQFHTCIQSVAGQGRVLNPSDAPMDSLYYALDKYRLTVEDVYSTRQDRRNFLAIVRYFLQECQATFKKLPANFQNQDMLVIAISHQDIEGVKLFVQHGMLQLPPMVYQGSKVNVLEMVKTGKDIDGRAVLKQSKKAYALMLPYLEGRQFSFIAKKVAIVALATAIVACGVKKAYDWFLPSSDEQDEQEASQEGTGIAASEREQVDPVGA